MYNTDELQTMVRERRFTALRIAFAQLNPADIAEFLSEELEKMQLALIFRIIPKDKAADTFAYLDGEARESLIGSITDHEIADLINNELFVDDTVDMLEELPANLVKRVLAAANPETRELINRFLQYPEDSAGSIMTDEFVDLKAGMTVRQAFDHIRKIGEDKETIYTCYVIDANRILQGVVNARDLMLSDYEATLRDIMHVNLISATTTDDREFVSELCSKYDLLAVPITDSERRLVGIVTVDDVLHVIEQEATEDFELMAAMKPSEKPYLRTGVFSLARNRVMWLMLLMISATLSGSILMHYEAAFAMVPLLVALMPMLTDTGGNAGCQSSTLIIRGMAVGEIEPRDILLVVWKELRVSLLCGAALAAVNFVRVLLVYPGQTSIAFVVSIALVATVIMAKVVGSALPIIAKVCKLDPAIMAAPLITTLVDAGALLLYFEIARLVLHI
ncbi:MAG: magnesium transporter [Oscillospiraceae bacterium]|jgi:magnesium transporter|nr:magnesium transporter [Oscillospiraceae bacterium]